MEHCQSLRADTHADNKIMQHLLEKNGFTRCGVIHVAESADAEPAMQDCARRLFVCPRSLRPAPLDGDGENKAANGRTCPCYKYRSTENPHGHRPECKFVNEKMSENAFISLPYVL